MSRYYATIRVELLTGSDEVAIEMADKIQIKREDGVFAEKAYLCYVTKQDGLESETLVNNID